MGISTFRSRPSAAVGHDPAFYAINIVLYLPVCPARAAAASVNPTYCPKITFALRTHCRGKSNLSRTTKVLELED